MNRNDRSVLTLAAVGHTTVHTYELSIPVFLTVWIAEFGATEVTLGVVVTVGYALFGLGAVPGGLLADRLGSRRLVFACLAGMAGAFALLAVAPTLPVVALALALWG
ncbi:MFS transporter, partial [Halobacteriales archaeon SW_7_68_16]